MKAPPIDPVVLAGELEDAVSESNRIGGSARDDVTAEVHFQEMAEGSARAVLMIQVSLPGAC